VHNLLFHIIKNLKLFLLLNIMDMK